ncbi:protein FAM53A-like [Glandiceps talaboti]
MVTLITDKLQNQSLEDAKVTTYEQIIPYRTRSQVKYLNLGSVKSLENKGGNVFVVNAPTTECDCKTIGNNKLLVGKGDREQQGSHGASVTPACQNLPAPPNKRHCRSRSTGELSGNTKTKWQPKASSIWKPVRSKYHREHASNSPLHFTTVSAAHCGPNLPIGINEFTTPPESPVPRPASATFDNTAPWFENSPMRHAHVQKVRSLSLSEDRISESSTPSVNHNADLLRKQFGLPRCRSQPCVLDRKGGLKRRRDDDIGRPALDFEKMKETSYDRCGIEGTHNKQYLTVGHSRSLATLFKEPDKFLGLMPIASSPCDSNLSSVMITPTSSPTKELNANGSLEERDASTKDESLKPSDGLDCNQDDEIFHLDHDDLDLDLDSIEKH